jgi:hypothetical protein
LKVRLLALPIEIRAFLAKRLPASALTQILPLNVVARIAVLVVVMNGLFDGVPRRLLRHYCFPFSYAANWLQWKTLPLTLRRGLLGWRKADFCCEKTHRKR